MSTWLSLMCDLARVLECAAGSPLVSAATYDVGLTPQPLMSACTSLQVALGHWVPKTTGGSYQCAQLLSSLEHLIPSPLHCLLQLLLHTFGCPVDLIPDILEGAV